MITDDTHIRILEERQKGRQRNQGVMSGWRGKWAFVKKKKVSFNVAVLF